MCIKLSSHEVLRFQLSLRPRFVCRVTFIKKKNTELTKVKCSRTHQRYVCIKLQNYKQKLRNLTFNMEVTIKVKQLATKAFYFPCAKNYFGILFIVLSTTVFSLF